jgi:hypothetical protein
LITADVYVHCDNNTDCPDVIGLEACNSPEDLFLQLEHYRPEEFESKKLKAVTIRLTNFDAGGITVNPNCRILRDGVAKGHNNLVDILQRYTDEAKPKLRLTVQFCKMSCSIQLASGYAL